MRWLIAILKVGLIAASAGVAPLGIAASAAHGQAADPYASAREIAAAEARLAYQPGAAELVFSELTSGGSVRLSPHPFRPDRRLARFVMRAPAEAASVRLDSVLAAPYARTPVVDYVRDFTLPMRRLGGSHIWTLTVETPLEAAATYSYRITTPQGEIRVGDPQARLRLDGSDAEAVLLIGRPAGQAASLAYRGRNYPVAETFHVDSAVLGGSQRIELWRAPGARPDAASASPLLIVQDSFLWGVRAPAARIAANLAADGLIPPVHIVLVDSVNGDSAATAYGREGDWIADELLPALATLGIEPGRRHVAVAGASRRGLAAARAALDRPDAIGAALPLSGSFYWAPPGEAPEWLARTLGSAPEEAPRFILAAGSLETVITEANAGHVMLEANRRMAAALTAHGYEAELIIYAGGHDIAGWRGALAQALITLWGESDAVETAE